MIFVGKIENVPAYVKMLPDFALIAHPRDFHKVREKLRDEHYFTNNVDLVNHYTSDKVMVCGDKGMKTLKEHPEYDKWVVEFSSGEFWSMVGEDWVTESQEGESK